MKKCTATKVAWQSTGYVCERCSTNWFESMGAPWCGASREEEKKAAAVPQVAMAEKRIEIVAEPYFEDYQFEMYRERQDKLNHRSKY